LGEHFNQAAHSLGVQTSAMIVGVSEWCYHGSFPFGPAVRFFLFAALIFAVSASCFNPFSAHQRRT
jgi:hypothetical protein